MDPRRPADVEDRGDASVRPPERTETYLFTDIEGSTRLLQALGERFAQVLVDQRRLLLDAAKRHGGIERGNAGDGSFVVFASARAAVHAAADAQHALAQHAWPEGASVRVRMGMHSGESPVADEVYAGLDVFRAARIAAAGHGGQVLLSEVTARLVERDLADGLSLRDLGMHALKDLERPERIWQVEITGLANTFPALKSLDVHPGNLPTDPGPIIGRDPDVKALAGLLAGEAVRLVTLTGPGGVGKTRLAIEVAKRVAGAFPDGAFFVPLASLVDPAGIPDRIAEALSLADRGSLPAIEVIESFLRPRRTLIVLDNVEQVASGADVVARLLRACAGLKVVATSRVVLRLSLEREVPVGPLAAPGDASEEAVERLASFPAVALFVERARAVRPEFALTEQNAAAVARICRDLDGLPLAIELAAARVKLFSPQAMLARLGRRLELLKGGAIDRPARQQTLRQAIGWSHDLLGARERVTFRRLACFSGGFTLDAAAAVSAVAAAGDVADGATLDTEDAVAALLDNSLLRTLDAGADEPRFTMLATIQEYAAELLDESEEAHGVRDAHAEHFLSLAEEAAPHLTGPDQGQWIQRLERERGNLHAALDWLQARDAHAEALRLGAALWRFWVARGLLRTGGDRLEALLALSGAQERAAVRARALHGAGTIFAERADFPRAQRYLDEALGIWRELGDERGLTTSLNSLSWASLLNGDVRRAEALASEAIALARTLGDVRGESVARYNLGQVALARGDLAEAHALVTQASELRHRAGDRRGEAYTKVSMAFIEEHQGRYDVAWAHVEEGDAVLRELGDRQIGAWATQTRGRIRLGLGDVDGARRYLAEARTRWFESGNLNALARTIADIAEAELAVGAVDEAARTARESLDISRDIGGLGAFTPVLPMVATVALAEGDVARAAALAEEARATANALGAQLLAAETLEVDAGLAYRRDDLDAAVRAASQAAALRQRIGAVMRRHAARRHAEMLESVRDRMGADAFEKAWAGAREGGDGSAGGE